MYLVISCVAFDKQRTKRSAFVELTSSFLFDLIGKYETFRKYSKENECGGEVYEVVFFTKDLVFCENSFRDEPMYLTDMVEHLGHLKPFDDHITEKLILTVDGCVRWETIADNVDEMHTERISIDFFRNRIVDV